MNKSTLWYQKKRLEEKGTLRIYNNTKRHFVQPRIYQSKLKADSDAPKDQVRITWNNNNPSNSNNNVDSPH